MLNLERSDLLQLEPISYRNTLKLLPLGKKNKQKLIIGDDSGQIACYEFKKGEPQVVFQAKPFEGPITSVELGGNPQKRDKLFASHSQRIVGLTKKGKDFFKLTSSLTETIQQMAIEDTRIWTSCEYLHNLYDNGKEMAYYISPGQINALLVCHLTRENEYDTVLACHDRYIRILHIATPFIEIPTKYPVLSIAQLEMDRFPSSNGRRTGHLFYGTSKGSLGYVRVLQNATFEIIWEVEDDDKRSAINCLKLYDINKDNVSEILIGRDDGRIEVYKINVDDLATPPTKIFSKDIGQSIRAIECGVVNTPDFPEIIVAAYTGKVISFTTEPIRNRSVEDTYGRSIQTVNNENRIKTLKKEIDELKKKVEKEREKAKKAGISASAMSNFIKPPSDFPVNSSFDLDYAQAAYILTIELQMPIDLVILRSPVVLDLVETDTGSSVLSVTPPSMNLTGNEEEGKFVAVFRCQSNERRINLSLRSNEGEYGDLVITIVAASNPKIGKVIKYELKPLSLHTKIHELSSEEAARPKNRIRYSGSIAMSTLHEWVQSLFPDVPTRYDENAIHQKYYFKNTFTSAIAVCEFSKNEIIVESESASTIAIAKETITRLANYRRITLDEFVNANDQSVTGFLNLIRGKVEYQLSLTRKIQLVDAIQELAMQDPNSSDWLSPEYTEILRDQENIRQQFKKRDRSLEYLTGIITDLYVDWNRIQGTDMRHKIPQLQNLIFNNTNNDFQQIIKFFNLKT